MIFYLCLYMCFGHGKVKVSKVQVWKTIRLRDSNVTFERSNHLHGYKLNDPESANKYCSEFHRHQRRTKLQANASSEFSINPHDSEVAPPQKDGKSLGATLDLIYRYSRAYTLKGTVKFLILTITPPMFIPVKPNY